MSRKFIIKHPDGEAWLTQYGFQFGVQAREMALRFDTEEDATRYFGTLNHDLRKLKHVVEAFNSADDAVPVGHMAATEYDPYGLNRFK